MAILYPKSLADLVTEVGTRHSHQILLKIVLILTTNDHIHHVKFCPFNIFQWSLTVLYGIHGIGVLGESELMMVCQCCTSARPPFQPSVVSLQICRRGYAFIMAGQLAAINAFKFTNNAGQQCFNWYSPHKKRPECYRPWYSLRMASL